jgi:hypothetical protein
MIFQEVWSTLRFSTQFVFLSRAYQFYTVFDNIPVQSMKWKYYASIARMV